MRPIHLSSRTAVSYGVSRASVTALVLFYVPDVRFDRRRFRPNVVSRPRPESPGSPKPHGAGRPFASAARRSGGIPTMRCVMVTLPSPYWRRIRRCCADRYSTGGQNSGSMRGCGRRPGRGGRPVLCHDHWSVAIRTHGGHAQRHRQRTASPTRFRSTRAASGPSTCRRSRRAPTDTGLVSYDPSFGNTARVQVEDQLHRRRQGASSATAATRSRRWPRSRATSRSRNLIVKGELPTASAVRDVAATTSRRTRSCTRT